MKTITYDPAVYKLVPIKALKHAYQLGQIYWQQADSESYSQNRASDITAQKFKDLDTAVPADLPGVVTHSGNPVAYLHTWKNGTRQCLSRRLTPVGDDAPADAVVWPLYTHAEPAEVEQLRQRVKELEGALRFYANGDHFTLHDSSAWDTVSGEPANFYEDESNTATVEDGSIAKMALTLLEPSERAGQNKWQTMETSPTDGTEIIGCSEVTSSSPRPDLVTQEIARHQPTTGETSFQQLDGTNVCQWHQRHSVYWKAVGPLFAITAQQKGESQ